MISVVQLGQIDYAEGLRLQRKLVDLRKAGEIGDVLLLLEHSPVITLGRNAKAANVIASPEALAARGVEVFESDRGGDVTFHGPGQLVGYPIFDLRGFASAQPSAVSHQPSAVSYQVDPSHAADDLIPSWRKTLGAVDYVRRLEEVLIRTCGDYGIPTRRVAGLTGAWTENEPAGKIAAIGVHISRSVTSHGFALNVNTDLSYFNLIVPCGITTKPVTSLKEEMRQELGREIEMARVAETVSRHFGGVFGSQMLWVETVDALLRNSIPEQVTPDNDIGVPLKLPRGLRRLRGEDDSHWA